MPHTWQTQEAKTKFSELIRQAQNEPQIVTSHGKAIVVMVSAEMYDSLISKKKSIFDTMRSCPYPEIELDVSRDYSGPREIKL